MPLIFVSYRHDDTRLIIGRIGERLKRKFGSSSIFIDQESIRAGINFKKLIDSKIAKSDVLLVIIGPHWAKSDKDKQSRLLEQGDFVRQEIEKALQNHIHIIPVLIGYANIPSKEDLPETLLQLLDRNASRIDPGINFNYDINRLIKDINTQLGLKYGLIQKRLIYISIICVSILLPSLIIIKQIRGNNADTTLREAEAVQRCIENFDLDCAQRGGIFGSPTALSGLRECKKAEIIRSDTPSLYWKDVWTTNVYSYAPGVGGRGGGLDDDVLKVGGWGDFYFTLIQFALPLMERTPRFSALALYVKSDEAVPVPLEVDQIIARWDFPKGERLWWKDKPGARAITTDPLPAPKQNQWYIIDLSKVTREWQEGKYQNFGIQLRPTSNNGSFSIFLSSNSLEKSRIPRLIFCA